MTCFVHSGQSISLRLPCVVFAASVLVVAAASSSPAEEPLHVRIDQMIARDHFGPAAPLADDAEFLRRASLNINGVIPSPAATKEFLDDKSPNKRTVLIDRLFESFHFARHMADVFDGMFMERRTAVSTSAPEWKNYLRESFAQNKPYNQLVREILACDGTDLKTRPLVRFYLDRNVEPNLLTREVSRIFFGRDIQCAQCHNHPVINDYHQSEYYGLNAFLSRSILFSDEKAKATYLGEKAEGAVKFQSVFDKSFKDRTLPALPGGLELDEPTFPPGQEYVVAPAKDVRPVPKYSRRVRMAEEATNGKNRAFNRNIANRLWAVMMGRGLVHPVDLLHPDNPPTHPELLDLLTDDVVARNFDVKSFLRELALTEAFQRSIELPAGLPAMSTQAEAQLTALQQSQTQLAQLSDESSKLVEKPSETLLAARRKAYDTADELAKADEGVAAAQKPVAAAAKLVETSRNVLAARENLAKSLATAAAMAQAAGKDLPGLQSVTQAAEAFQKQSQDLSAQFGGLSQTIEQQVAAQKGPAEQLAVAQAASSKVAIRLDEETRSAAGLHPAYLDALTKQRHDLTLANATSGRVEDLRSFVEFAKLQTAADAAQVEVNAVNSELAVAQQAAAKAQAELASLNTQLASLTQATAGAGANSGNVDALRQQIAASTTTSSQLQANLKSVEVKLQSAIEKSAPQQAAAASAQQSLVERWSKSFDVHVMSPLSPEQFAWAVMQATGVVDNQRAATTAELDQKQPLKEEEKKDPAKLAARAKEIDEKVFVALIGNVDPFIALFGAGAGQPQSDFFATVDQSLFLANAPTVQAWLAPSGSNLTARLAAIENPQALSEELYLSVLTRRPTTTEVADVTEFLAVRKDNRPAAIVDLAWALLTSSEFRFNH